MWIRGVRGGGEGLDRENERRLQVGGVRGNENIGWDNRKHYYPHDPPEYINLKRMIEVDIFLPGLLAVLSDAVHEDEASD